MLLTLCFCLFQTEMSWGEVHHGEAPPPLTIESVIQGDWDRSMTLEDLKGKPVVLEFWASWCVPCVHAIPHMNELFGTFGSQIHFLHLSNEPEAVIRRTAKAKGMKGNLLQIPKAVTLSYGARVIPRTIVLNAQGHVVAVTQPEDLTPERLEKLVRGEDVQFPGPKYQPADLTGDDTLSGQIRRPFGQVIFQTGDAEGTGVRYLQPGHMLISGASLPVLLQIAYDLNGNRLNWAIEKPKQKYRVSVIAPDGQNATAKRMLAQNLPLMLGIRTVPEQTLTEVFLLKRAATGELALQPSEEKRSTSANGNSLNLEGGTLADLASLLADFAVTIPVVDETDIPGTYSVSLSWVSGDMASIQSALAKLGLALVRGERPVPTLRIEAASF